jgi:uncharacterized membrane protein YciS (DUF1049 family)
MRPAFQARQGNARARERTCRQRRTAVIFGSADAILKMRVLLAALLFVAVFAAGLLLGHANSATVTFDYVVGVVQLRLISLLLIAFGIGVALTFMVCYGRLFMARRDLRRLRRRLRDADEELKTLRTLPVTPAPR